MNKVTWFYNGNCFMVYLNNKFYCSCETKKELNETIDELRKEE